MTKVIKRRRSTPATNPAPELKAVPKAAYIDAAPKAVKKSSKGNPPHIRAMGDLTRKAGSLRKIIGRMEKWEKFAEYNEMEEHSVLVDTLANLGDAVQSLEVAADELQKIPPDVSFRGARKTGVQIGDRMVFKDAYAEDYVGSFIDAADESFEITKMVKRNVFVARTDGGLICRVVRSQIEYAEDDDGEDEDDSE